MAARRRPNGRTTPKGTKGPAGSKSQKRPGNKNQPRPAKQKVTKAKQWTPPPPVHTRGNR